jgi:hypothetical protein
MSYINKGIYMKQTHIERRITEIDAEFSRGVMRDYAGLDRLADVEASTERFDTPQHHALVQGYRSIYAALPTPLDNYGSEPIRLAAVESRALGRGNVQALMYPLNRHISMASNSQPINGFTIELLFHPSGFEQWDSDGDKYLSNEIVVADVSHATLVDAVIDTNPDSCRPWTLDEINAGIETVEQMLPNGTATLQWIARSLLDAELNPLLNPRVIAAAEDILQAE